VTNERQHFDRLFRETGHTWWGRTTPAGRRRDEKKMALFRELIRPRPGETLLEVGCGSGEFTTRLRGLGLEVRAFDLTAPCVAHAALDLAGDPGFGFCVADIGKIPFRTGAFDICFGVSILHHVPVAPAFAEIARVLRPGGRFFFSEPNLLNPQILIEKKIPWVKARLEGTPDETAFLRGRLGRRLNAIPGVKARVRNIDFLHPALPARWVDRAARASDVLEKVPLLREISGSLAIWGTIGE